jgi:hypothetical protein
MMNCKAIFEKIINNSLAIDIHNSIISTIHSMYLPLWSLSGLPFSAVPGPGAVPPRLLRGLCTSPYQMHLGETVELNPFFSNPWLLLFQTGVCFKYLFPPDSELVFLISATDDPIDY